MTVVKGPGQSGKAYEFAAGIGQHLRDDPTMHTFIMMEVREQVALYEESGDGLHLWRAWRIARTMGDIPQDIFAILAPMIDKFSEAAIAPKKRAEDRTNRYYVMRDYHYLKGVMENPRGRRAPKSVAEIYRKLAKSFDTTEGAIKQMVLEHTYRGQRGRNRRQR